MKLINQGEVIMKTKKKIIISLLVICGCIGTYFGIESFSDKKVKINTHEKASKDFSNWVEFAPEDKNFSIKFPKTPETSFKELPIPKSSDTLPYHEHKSLVMDKYPVSISYTTLPDNIVKHSANLVLKGSLKLLMAELGADLIGSNSNAFNSHSALDFQHSNGEMQTIGTLILVDSTLYKLEISFPTDHQKEIEEDLSYFIRSFIIKQ